MRFKKSILSLAVFACLLAQQAIANSKCPLPTNWTAVSSPLAKPAWVGGQRWPYKPTVLVDEEGNAIDLRTIVPDFPYKHAMLAGTDHASGGGGGIDAYYFDDDPNKLTSHDDAVAAGKFAHYGTAGTDYPAANPILTHTDATGATAQLETPRMFIRLSDGRIGLTGHAQHGLEQFSHTWVTDNLVTWTRVGFMASTTTQTGAGEPEPGNGNSKHYGYAALFPDGGRILALSLHRGGTLARYALWEDADGDGADMTFVRTFSQFDPGQREIGLSGTQQFNFGGERWAVAIHRQSGSSGTSIGHSEIVAWPWRKESSISPSDNYQALGGQWFTLMSTASLTGGHANDGWAGVPAFFRLNGKWWAYAAARREDGLENTLVLLEGRYDTSRRGVIGELQSIYGSTMLAWDRVQDGLLLCTDGVNHGTIEGVVSSAQSLIPRDPSESLLFSGNVANRVNIGRLATLTKIWNGPFTVVLPMESGSAAHMGLGCHAGIIGESFMVNINVGGLLGQFNLVTRSDTASNVLRVSSNSGITDGSPHVAIFTVGQQVADSAIHLDGVKQSLDAANADDAIRPIADQMSRDWFIGARNVEGTLSQSFDGKIGPILIFRRHLSSGEIGEVTRLFLEGSDFVPRPPPGRPSPEAVAVTVRKQVDSNSTRLATLDTKLGTPSTSIASDIAAIDTDVRYEISGAVGNSYLRISPPSDTLPASVRWRRKNSAGEYFNSVTGSFDASPTDWTDYTEQYQGVLPVPDPIQVNFDVAGQVQTAMPSDTYELEIIENQSTPSDAGTIVQRVTGIVWDVSTDAFTAFPVQSATTDDILTAILGIDASALGSPREQEPVPRDRRAMMVRASGGLAGEEPIELNVGDDDVLLSADFSRVLPRNGRIHEIISVVGATGLQVSSVGVDHGEAKFSATPISAGEYVVFITVKYSNQGGTHKARVRIKASD